MSWSSINQDQLRPHRCQFSYNLCSEFSSNVLLEDMRDSVIKEYQQKFNSYVISCFAFQWTKDVKLTEIFNVMHNSPNNSYSVSACPQIHLPRSLISFTVSGLMTAPLAVSVLRRFSTHLSHLTQILVCLHTCCKLHCMAISRKRYKIDRWFLLKSNSRIMRSIEWWQCPTAHAMDIAWAVGHCHAMS